MVTSIDSSVTWSRPVNVVRGRLTVIWLHPPRLLNKRLASCADPDFQLHRRDPVNTPRTWAVLPTHLLH